jgi:hypothetical protein
MEDTCLYIHLFHVFLYYIYAYIDLFAQPSRDMESIRIKERRPPCEVLFFFFFFGRGSNQLFDFHCCQSVNSNQPRFGYLFLLPQGFSCANCIACDYISTILSVISSVLERIRSSSNQRLSSTAWMITISGRWMISIKGSGRFFIVLFTTHQVYSTIVMHT